LVSLVSMIFSFFTTLLTLVLVTGSEVFVTGSVSASGLASVVTLSILKVVLLAVSRILSASLISYSLIIFLLSSSALSTLSGVIGSMLPGRVAFVALSLLIIFYAF